MKLLYSDISLNKDYKHFKEWHYLYTGTNSIKKKGYLENYNFIGKNIFSLILYILATTIWINIYQNSNENFIKILSIVLIAFCIFYIMFYIMTFVGYFIYYHNFKKMKSNKKKNSLTINEEGITDVTDFITISSIWEQLTHILIGEYYIVITTTTNIVYIFPIDIKDKLITGINKYNVNKKLKIIEKTF